VARSPRPGSVSGPASPACELDALLARVAHGDRSAFTPLFQQLWPRVLRLTQRLLRHEADAADAAQEAMHKLLTRASDYDPTRPALPWALALAAWESRTIARKRARRAEVADDGLGAASAPACIEQDLVARNLMRAAVDALGELSARDRETLLASYWEEAQHACGPTFRKRRERALQRLRSVFRRLYGID